MPTLEHNALVEMFRRYDDGVMLIHERARAIDVVAAGARDDDSADQSSGTPSESGDSG